MSRHLDGYVRQAERFGAELVFDTAAGLTWPFRAHLSIRELGYLALRLRNLDPAWRLPKPDDGAFEVRGLDAADFALLLVAEGVDERDACRMAGVSRRTMQRRQRPAREALEQARDLSKSPPEPAFQTGETATRRGSGGDWSSTSHLSLFEVEVEVEDVTL